MKIVGTYHPSHSGPRRWVADTPPAESGESVLSLFIRYGNHVWDSALTQESTMSTPVWWWSGRGGTFHHGVDGALNSRVGVALRPPRIMKTHDGGGASSRSAVTCTIYRNKPWPWPSRRVGCHGEACVHSNFIHVFNLRFKHCIKLWWVLHITTIFGLWGMHS